MSWSSQLAQLVQSPRAKKYRSALSSRQSLPGREIATELGVAQLVERVVPRGSKYGATPIDAARSVHAELMAAVALDPSLQRVDLGRALFLDTETTGLSGGAGTVAFLIGAAFFEDCALRIEQCFLRGFGQEAPMLRWLADRIADASAVVTFNGKSFDWPLLRMRYVMNRVSMPDLPPHLDLLHCARRVFRPRLRSLRLVALERDVLGKFRRDDIPGEDIPAAYARYLRSGDTAEIERVIQHNQDDLIAMVALLGAVCDRYGDAALAEEPEDSLACAELAARAGDEARAHRVALAVAGRAEPCRSELSAKALVLAARVARRRGAVNEEQRLLHRALALETRALEHGGSHGADSLFRAELRLSLAKLYEHRVRDPEQALHHARLTHPAETEAERSHRVARLNRKLGSSEARVR